MESHAVRCDSAVARTQALALALISSALLRRWQRDALHEAVTHWALVAHASADEAAAFELEGVVDDAVGGQLRERRQRQRLILLFARETRELRRALEQSTELIDAQAEQLRRQHDRLLDVAVSCAASEVDSDATLSMSVSTASAVLPRPVSQPQLRLGQPTPSEASLRQPLRPMQPPPHPQQQPIQPHSPQQHEQRMEQLRSVEQRQREWEGWGRERWEAGKAHGDSGGTMRAAEHRALCRFFAAQQQSRSLSLSLSGALSQRESQVWHL